MFFPGGAPQREPYSLAIAHILNTIFFLKFIVIIVCAFVCMMCMWGLYAEGHVWKTEDNFVGLALSFHHDVRSGH